MPCREVTQAVPSDRPRKTRSLSIELNATSEAKPGNDRRSRKVHCPILLEATLEDIQEGFEPFDIPLDDYPNAVVGTRDAIEAKFGIPVCPHAGGLGLCEYVQHISAIDFIVVSGQLDGRSTEFADHLHEHFVDPVRVVGGHYQLPSRPGYSAEMHPESLAQLAYPHGEEWVDRHRC